MNGARASAPGKILIAGEYAVLGGAPAVVMAVERRAVARDTGRPQTLSLFLAAARDEIARELGEESPAAQRAARVKVDSSALTAGDGRKLGLGSSAASTVAALTLALAGDRAGGEGLSSVDRRTIHRLARAAHGQAQAGLGARGSGVDVTAAVYGGLLRVTPAGQGQLPEVARLPLPEALTLVPVWTGQPADTARLIAGVHAFATEAPARYRELAVPLGTVAGDLADAFARGDVAGSLAAITAGARAVAALGEAAGLPLEAPIHRDLGRLAGRRGGAVKPTGAGAGDIALAAFPSPEAAAAFRTDLEELGIVPLLAGVDANGASLG